MNYLSSLHAEKFSIFWPRKNSASNRVLLVLAGVCLLAAASQLSIPIEPVPLTFQSMTVVLIGMVYGARYGAYVMTTYLIAGALGLPIFADFSGGIVKLFGPTGGYLAGFLPAAFLSGYLAQKGWAKNVFSSFAVACLGASIIFFFGIAWLAKFVGLQQAITMGLLPFVLSETIKLIAVSLLIPKVWKKAPHSHTHTS